MSERQVAAMATRAGAGRQARGGEAGAAGPDGRDDGPAPVPRRLLAAATRLFAEQGYDRTSVQEIVEAAGVTKGALYHYFGSKDDLLHEIYGRLLRLQQERLDLLAEREAPVEERLRQAAADVVVTTIENLDDAMIFFRSMHQLSPEKQKQVRAERRRYHERFRALIEEGRRAGVFSDATPADLVVDYHFGSVHHLSSWYRPGGRLSPQQVADHLADLLLRALRP
ncbi:TetR/AcrR family transcriptional regulator [Streptomyces smyrnaeus]